MSEYQNMTNLKTNLIFEHFQDEYYETIKKNFLYLQSDHNQYFLTFKNDLVICFLIIVKRTPQDIYCKSCD